MALMTETETIIFEKYGTTLNLEELSRITKVTVATIRNKISDETFEIPTYKNGRKRLADFRDVATYLDNVRPV